MPVEDVATTLFVEGVLLLPVPGGGDFGEDGDFATVPPDEDFPTTVPLEPATTATDN